MRKCWIAMSIRILIILHILVVQINAQLTLYVKPIVDFKAFISSSKHFSFSDYVLNPSPYYFYNNKAVYVPDDGSFSLGLNVGLRSKNKKLTLELGFLDDATQSGRIVYEINTTNGSNYFDNSSSLIDGCRFQKVILQNTIKLKTFKNNTSISAVFGYSYAYRKANQVGLVSFDEGTLSTVDYNTTMLIRNRLIVYKLNNHFLNFGISSEIYSKNKYLLDLTLFYEDGFYEMSSVMTDITITENNLSKKITYSSNSCGSGFHLQISRKFQVLPLVKQKKRE